MYIVRWLMGHPIIAVWVLGAIAILLSMSAANQHEAEEVTVSHKVESNQASKEANHINDTTTFEATEVTNNNHKTASAPEEEQATEKTEGAVTATINNVVSAAKDAKDATITNVKQATESIIEKPTSAVGAIAPTVENAKNTVSTSTKQAKENLLEKSKDIVQKVKEAQITNSLSLEPQNANGQISSNDSTHLAQTSSTAEMLVIAREAYWNNGFDEAAQLYLQLIKLAPNNMDYKGELGNVYWRQGYPKKAAELYSEIALPMIENGNSDRVANMVGFIGLFYPDRAAMIHQRIMLKKSGN